jgi:hypothetical protein
MFNDNNFFGGSAGGGDFYSTTIDGSLRFNDNDSAYLSRTPSSAGNRRTWTISFWIKRGDSSDGTILSSNSNTFWIDFDTGGNFACGDFTSSYNFKLNPAMKFRDHSAWYHVVVSVDTTQATDSNRGKLYINGEQVTTWGDVIFPSQNYESTWNTATLCNIGRRTSGYYLDAYLTEFHAIDGQALDADDFGEFKSGVWVPKAYEGSYGTNGFYLPLTSDANDDSGNGNNWTANNIASTDYVLDSPTNNFATLNPLVNGYQSATFSEGNLFGSGASDYSGAYGTISVSSGKWYWEIQHTHDANWSGVQLIAGIDWDATYTQSLNGALGYRIDNGNARIDGTNITAFTSGATSNLFRYALDMDGATLAIYKDTTLVGTFDLTDSSYYSSGVMAVPMIGLFGTARCNFGQDSSFAGNKTAQGNPDANGYGDFYYAPPSGYLALCTANLPDPVASIDPAQDGSPQDHFNMVLWSGDGSTSARSLTGVGFQPDFVWAKMRSGFTASHMLWDVVRGTGETADLSSDKTNAEGIFGKYGYLSSFNSDGFSVTGGSDPDFPTNVTNRSGATYVAWNWKAGGSGSSNTDGSITSTVSANTDAGFSIVSYTGTNANATIGHGLNSAPEFVIWKKRINTDNWIAYHSGAGLGRLKLDDTVSVLSTYNAQYFNNSAPTASVINLGVWLSAPEAHICYAFHSVDGFSKFGKYTGNGSSDGTFVYTGFTPAFIMIKNASLSGTSWEMFDTTRQTYNQNNLELLANSSGAEGTYTFGDILSNGFKHRGANNGVNNTGYTYIYMAFAKNPFKYANAR